MSSQMAQEPYSKLEEVTSSSKKRCRCSTTYVQIACQISCIALLIICVVSIERRLSFLENRLDTMAEEFKKDQSTDHRSERSDGQKGVIRERRTVRDSKQANTLKSRSIQDKLIELRKLRKLLHLPGGPREGRVGQPKHSEPKAGHQHGAQIHDRVEQVEIQQWLPGVVYHHWGRPDCPGGSSVVYHGYMANSHHTNLGGGSNFVCLTSNATYNSHSSPQGEGTSIYGAKYQTKFHGFKKNLNDNRALCAACYTEHRGSQIVIPATNVCPLGWTLEYRGYLMSAHYQDHHSSEFVCVDEEAQPGGTTFSEGAALYVVESLCDPLPCKPFANGYQLSCVVCTK